MTTPPVPIFATRDRHHSANVHIVVEVAPTDELAEIRKSYPAMLRDHPDGLVATFACGGGSGFDYQVVDSETEKPFCDRCLLADLNPAVYKTYDRFNRLLYVGSSGSLIERFIGHSSKKAPWMKSTVRVEVDTYVDLPAARRAEAETIESELPLYNRRGIPMSAWSGVA